MPYPPPPPTPRPDRQAIVTLLPEEAGGPRHHGLPESPHDGLVTFSGVHESQAEGVPGRMDGVVAVGPSINHSGPWYAYRPPQAYLLPCQSKHLCVRCVGVYVLVCTARQSSERAGT